MIVSDKRSWLSMVFAMRGSSLRTTWPRISFVTMFALVVTLADRMLGFEFYSLTTAPFTLMGIAMAIFLGFRNNESYDRFWEGRTLWGGLVNVSRSFSRQALTLLVAPADSENEAVAKLKRRMVRAAIAYPHALRHHLRQTDLTEDVSPYLAADDLATISAHNNKPVALLQHIGELIHGAWRAGYIHDLHVPVLEESLTTMTNLQGGCERIKNTPIPFSYSVLLHRVVAVYCLAMPFGLLETTGVLTPVAVCLISYAFFGLDAIGDEVEQPFDTDDNDLPLHAICRTIEINLLQLLGDAETPEPLRPVNGVLL